MQGQFVLQKNGYKMSLVLAVHNMPLHYVKREAPLIMVPSTLTVTTLTHILSPIASYITQLSVCLFKFKNDIQLGNKYRRQKICSGFSKFQLCRTDDGASNIFN